MIGSLLSSEYLPGLIVGTEQTILLTVATLLVGLAISVPVALCRLSARPTLRWSAVAFVFVFRGTPLLALLYLIYYGAPEVAVVRHTWLWTLFRQPVPCAVLALSLNSAGYLSEIVAGAIRGVPHGEVEAAEVAGLPRSVVFSRIVLPNAVRIGLRGYGNEVVFVIKSTAAGSLVTIVDVLKAAENIYFKTFDPFAPLIAAGAIYLSMVFAVSGLIRWGELHLDPGRRRPSGRMSREVRVATRETI